MYVARHLCIAEETTNESIASYGTLECLCTLHQLYSMLWYGGTPHRPGVSLTPGGENGSIEATNSDTAVCCTLQPS